MLVIQDLWRSSNPTSCSKQNCNHCWIASTMALPSLENLQRWRFITSLGNLSEGHTALLVGQILLMCNLNFQAAVCGCCSMLHHPILLRTFVQLCHLCSSPSNFSWQLIRLLCSFLLARLKEPTSLSTPCRSHCSPLDPVLTSLLNWGAWM